jgi:heavy metal sensor kinase
MKKIPAPAIFIHSIRFRLVMWFTAILALVLFVFSVFIYYNQTRDIRGDAFYRLERKLSDIQTALAGGSSAPVMLQESDVLVLLDSDGKVLAFQGAVTDKSVVGLVKNAQSAHQSVDASHSEPQTSWTQDWNGVSSHYFFVIQSISAGGQTGFAILGSPFDPYGLNDRLLFTLLVGVLLTLAVAMGGGLWLADRAMRPVHAITSAARTISETDLNRRLNITGKDELAELANTFDGMLARLQTAFERQRQFVADASHELRTPLTIVNLESSRALASRRTVDEYQRVLTVIRSENDFMSQLVNDLLTLARMDSGQMGMEMAPIDLSDITLEALERLSPLADRKYVRLETGDLPELTIQGDRRYLLQMLSNLIENGIKYTGGEEKKVRIDTGLDEGSAWVRVSDTGEGILPEHLPHLFNRFYRVDKVRSRNGEDEPGGNGLGLSIVEWIARAHDGEVRVESTPGKGTVFEVRFKPAG